MSNTAIASVVPLNYLPMEQVEAFSVRQLQIRKGQEIVRAGRYLSELIVPTDGQLVQCIDPGDGGFREKLPSFQPIGLDYILRGDAFPYSIVSEEDTTLCIVPWKQIKLSIDQIPGLSRYLRLLHESSAFQQLDQSLEDMGCSPAFRCALLGAAETMTLSAETWIAHEGDVPSFIFYGVLGNIQAYSALKRASALKSLWIVPRGIWQFWEACLHQKPLRQSFKTVSQVEIFKIRRQTLTELHDAFATDFASFEKIIASGNIPVEDQERTEEIETLEDLFPPPPRPVSSIRLKYPFVRQNDEMDCAAACMAMVSKYYGSDLPVQFWRDRLNTNQEGASLFDMANSAERVGFVTHGLEIHDLTGVEESLLPLIALRQYHFVLVYKIRRSKLLVGDPGYGVAWQTIEEFQKGFDGYVLMLKPTEQFYRASYEHPGYRHYWNMISGYRFEMGFILLTSALITALSMLPAFLTQFIIDQVLANREKHLLILGILAALIIGVLLSLTSWLRAYYMNFLSSRFDFSSASAFLRKLFSLPYAFFATRHLGDFTRRLSELERIRTLLTNRLIGTLLDLVTLAFYGVALLWYNPLIAIVVFLGAPLLVLLSIFFSYRMRRSFAETFHARAEQESLLSDQIKGIATIKTLGAEVAARWRFEEALVKTLRSAYEFSMTAATLSGISSMVHQALSFLVVGLAAWVAIEGHLTTGQVVSASILAAGVIGPFYSLAGLWSEIQEIRIILDRLNDVFLAEPEHQTQARALIKKQLRGEIEFRDVWFRYGGESSEWVLQGISFHILPHQSVAIVGPSGAGKSTLALLTARLYEPTKGTILIDGRDYREYDRQWLRQQMGLMLQETTLFHGTLLSNIAYGDPRPDIARVEKVLEHAQAKGFVQEKASGLDYLITHGGLGLSTGQKQRIGVARLLYADPRILFLDEATSSIESTAERALMESLKGTLHQRTLLNIAHRYSSVKMCDFVMVIQNGRVVQFGTNEELLKAGGLYTELFGDQINL